MKVEVLAIPDVKMITPDRHGDHRGYFVETWNHRRFAAALGVTGDELHFVQDNESLSAASGTLRGLHFQAPPFAQGKLVRVLSGSIFDVAVDIRRTSPTFSKWVGVELNAEAGNQLWIPAGFLHGFVTLCADTRVAYKVTAYYDKASDGAVSWSDPTIGIDWPGSLDARVISDKDRQAPLLGDISNPF